MSVGTIVTIVLLMSVLVLGIFLVQEIFSSSSNAIDQVNDQVTNQINDLFASGDRDLIVFPPSESVSIQRGSESPKGFAFAVRNPSKDEGLAKFDYEITPTDSLDSRCPGVSKEDVEGWMLGKSGSFELEPTQQSRATDVLFTIPETAPECQFQVKVDISSEDTRSPPSTKVAISITTGGGLF